MRTTGRVKWFDPGKGDGCVISDAGTQAALARATLADAGLHTIAPGTPLTYEVVLADDTLTVTALYEIDGRPPSHTTPRAPDPRPIRIRGKINWFDPAKGFGMIGSKDVESDVLLHHSVLQGVDTDALVPDATVECDVIQKVRGFQVTRLISLHDDGVRPPPLPSPPSAWPRRQRILIERQPAGPWVEAECKWYSRPKGYGFVVVRGDTEEIFVHMDTLRRSSVRQLSAGQNVKVRISRTEKGLMATEIAVVPAPEPKPRTPPPARGSAPQRTAGERKTGVIGHLLSVNEEKGFGIVDLPELDAIAIADIALLRAAGLLDPHARNCRLICDVEFAPPLIHIRCLTRLH